MSEDPKRIDGALAEIAAIVGPEHVRRATPADAVDGTEPTAVIAPGGAQPLAQVLRCCNEAGLGVIPRGGGTKLGLGNCPRKVDVVLSTERLSTLVEHAWDDMTATVEAGCTIAKFQAALQEHGQRLAADPMQPERATVGGVLATAESGTLRTRYGAMRDLVLGLELVLPDGNIVQAGGKVVKNVAGFDLTKLAIGSLGTIGVITRAVFRLHPVAVTNITFSTVLSSSATTLQVLLAILQSPVVFAGMQIRAERPDRIYVDVRWEGRPEALGECFGRLGKVAGGQTFAEIDPNVWAARQKLFANSAASTILKCSVQPAQIGSLCDIVFSCANQLDAAATMVAQATGLAEVRLDASGESAQVSALNAIRRELVKLGGTLVVQHCPVAVKRELDVWGPVGDSFPLMRRVKEKFDPARILNPGRFVGGL